MGKLLIFVGLALLLHVQLGSSYILSCYFTNWGQYRHGAGKYMPTNIDPCLCDHIIYAFAGIAGGGNIGTIEWNDVTLFGEVQALKKKNGNLKTLLSVGGWNKGFWFRFGNSEIRSTFMDSAVIFLRQYGFDGLDMAWEFPGSPPGEPGTWGDKAYFTGLCQELMAVFEAEGQQTNRPRLMLTAAVAAEKGVIDAGYQVPQLGAYLDYFHVMTYNFHGPWAHVTGENSPVWQGPADQGAMIDFNVNYAMNYWKSLGAPAEKLLVGFPTYGHTFKLASSSNTAIGAPSTGPGPAGQFTNTPGTWAYYEICHFLKQQGVTQVWDVAQQVPYAYNSQTWVGYDNVVSYQGKVGWLKRSGFGGAMVWTLDQDDFSGNFCGQGPYPLITALKNGLGSGGCRA